MINKIKKFIERKLHEHNYYHIDDLVSGGNCGCCGKHIKDEIFPKWWPWGLCDDCRNFKITDSP